MRSARPSVEGLVVILMRFFAQRTRSQDTQGQVENCLTVHRYRARIQVGVRTQISQARQNRLGIQGKSSEEEKNRYKVIASQMACEYPSEAELTFEYP